MCLFFLEIKYSTTICFIVVVGLPYVHVAGEVRRARRAGARRRLPQAAAALRVRWRRLQN